MRFIGVVLALTLATGCAIEEDQVRGPLDGEWIGLVGDGTQITLSIDQTQKASSGDHLVGTGVITWTALDGARTDDLLVDGSGGTQFVIELRRDISFSAGNPLQPIVVTGTLDASRQGAIGNLTGDDHYGLHFAAQQVLLTR